MRRHVAVGICRVLLGLSAVPVVAEPVPLERVFQGPSLNGVIARAFGRHLTAP